MNNSNKEKLSNPLQMAENYITCKCGKEILYLVDDLELATNTLIWGKIKCNNCKEEYLLKYTLKDVIKKEE